VEPLFACGVFIVRAVSEREHGEYGNTSDG